MGLFSKKVAQLAEMAGVSDLVGPKVDVWKDGVRTTAVIERVSVSGVESTQGSEASFEAAVVFRFTDTSGVEQLLQNVVWIAYPPPPGTTTEIAYFPDQLPQSITFKSRHTGPRDPSVPRGWGAGIFTMPPLGPYGAPMVFDGLDDTRELFRNGQPVEAVVTATHWGLLQRHGTNKCTMTVAVDGREYTTGFWAWGECVPDIGEHIKVVIGPDGSTIALDTDEAYYGPPGRALVWTTPADIQELRDNPTGLAAQHAAIDRMVAAGKLTEAQAAEMRDRVNPPAVTEPTTASMTSPILTKQLAALEMAHRTGKLTDDQYESMRSQILVNPPD